MLLKPHWGASGTPFMYRNTRLELMSFRIASSTLLTSTFDCGAKSSWESDARNRRCTPPYAPPGAPAAAPPPRQFPRPPARGTGRGPSPSRRPLPRQGRPGPRAAAPGRQARRPPGRQPQRRERGRHADAEAGPSASSVATASVAVCCRWRSRHHPYAGPATGRSMAD